MGIFGNINGAAVRSAALVWSIGLLAAWGFVGGLL